MQPYFDPTKRQPQKKREGNLKKKGRGPEKK
jgi:hypothetical protein